MESVWGDRLAVHAHVDNVSEIWEPADYEGSQNSSEGHRGLVLFGYGCGGGGAGERRSGGSDTTHLGEIKGTNLQSRRWWSVMC